MTAQCNGVWHHLSDLCAGFTDLFRVVRLESGQMVQQRIELFVACGNFFVRFVVTQKPAGT